MPSNGWFGIQQWDRRAFWACLLLPQGQAHETLPASPSEVAGSQQVFANSVRFAPANLPVDTGWGVLPVGLPGNWPRPHPQLARRPKHPFHSFSWSLAPKPDYLLAEKSTSDLASLAVGILLECLWVEGGRGATAKCLTMVSFLSMGCGCWCGG